MNKPQIRFMFLVLPEHFRDLDNKRPLEITLIGSPTPALEAFKDKDTVTCPYPNCMDEIGSSQDNKCETTKRIKRHIIKHEYRFVCPELPKVYQHRDTFKAAHKNIDCGAEEHFVVQQWHYHAFDRAIFGHRNRHRFYQDNEGHVALYKNTPGNSRGKKRKAATADP